MFDTGFQKRAIDDAAAIWKLKSAKNKANKYKRLDEKHCKSCVNL